MTEHTETVISEKIVVEKPKASIKPAHKAPVKATAPVKKAPPVQAPKVQKPLLEDLLGTIPTDVESFSDFDKFIHTSMFNLIKDSTLKYEAQALARLSLVGSMARVIEDNTKMSSSIIDLLERFEVSITSTVISGDNQVYEVTNPIARGIKYDTNTLHQGIIALIARFNSLRGEKTAVESSLASEKSAVERLTDENRRFSTEIAALRAVPPPSMVAKPFVIMRNIIIKEKPEIRYIGEDSELGFKPTGLINQALRFHTAEKAAEQFTHLCDHQADYPIKNVHQYYIASLHYVPYNITKLESETHLQLNKAIERARAND